MKKKLFLFVLTMVMTFSMSIPAMAAVSDTGFDDVNANAWYAEAVTYCRDNNLMSGTTATTFDVNTTMTRAMLSTVLYRMAGSPQVTADNPFSDVRTGAWYSNAALWAQQKGIVDGYGNGQFGTNDPVTREQVAAILWRYENSPTAAGSNDYSDEAEISSFATTAVDWARANGIINGKDNNRFDPKGQATRAEVATMLMNYRQKGTTAPTTNPEPTTNEEPKVLVAYFSATGTTKALAEYAADALNADLYEITPAVPYTSADLNYNNSSSRATVEMNDANSRPEISGSVQNIEEYDIVFLGYPIWWGEAPKIMSTFLEKYEFSDKTIIPFCTSGSSGIGSSATNLHNLTDGAKWLAGQRFSSGTSRDTIVDWVNGLNLDITAK